LRRDSLPFQIAQTGRPGPVLVDITKTPQQGTAIFDLPRPSHAPSPSPHAECEEHGLAQAVELIRNAKRP